jgi:protein-S-isoprenylcysteine O-methyltransferase Ste14
MRSASPLLHTLLFTVVAPGMVAGYIPWALRGSGQMANGPDLWIASLAIVLGAAIYLHTAFWGFALRGRGTPAPIAPTQVLVLEGLHQYVRNPMYIGVLLVILGQAILFHSAHIVFYALAFCVIVHLFVVLYEEPTLHRQFGAEYDSYKKRVPRWLPKI